MCEQFRPNPKWSVESITIVVSLCITGVVLGSKPLVKFKLRLQPDCLPPSIEVFPDCIKSIEPGGTKYTPLSASVQRLLFVSRYALDFNRLCQIHKSRGW
jgi:hypothetical protein